MTVAELGQGIRIYRDFLQDEIRTCNIMLKRHGLNVTYDFWKVTKDCLVGSLGKLERQFPFLREQ